MSNRWEESNGHYEQSSSRMASLDEYARASTPSATAEGRIAGGMDVDTSKGLPVGIPSFSRTTRGGGENSLAYGHGGGHGKSGESEVPHATTKWQTTAPAMSYPFLCREDVGVGVSVGDTYKDAQDAQAFVAPAPFDWQPSMPFAPDENVLDDDGMRMHRSSRGGSDSLYTSGGGGGMSANPYDLPSQRGGGSMSSSPYYQAPGMYSTQMVLPSSLSRLRSNQGVPGASKLLPREGRAAPPPPNPLEPSMPPVVFNRRFLKIITPAVCQICAKER